MREVIDIIKKPQKVLVRWNGSNKKRYISKGYTFTKMNEEFLIDVRHLAKNSIVKVVVVCDICKSNEYETSHYNANKTQEHVCQECKKVRNKITVNCGSCRKKFVSTRTALNRSKSGKLFCSNKCVGKYNSILKNKQKTKKCKICKSKYSVKPVHYETSVTCSVPCQNMWQSKYLVGENANNFQGGGGFKKCEECDGQFKCNTPSELKKRRFCSIDCKNKNWAETVITTESFKQNRFEGSLLYRQNFDNLKIETKPERMVRKWLEHKGFKKNKDFYQEAGFMNKYFADFYFPKYKLIIEVMGDYWHGNPNIYGKGKKPLSQQQIDRKEKDISKRKDFERNNYTYIEIWESDIYEDIDSIMNKSCLKYIPLTTARRTS